MAHHERRRDAPVAAAHVQVGVADAGRGDAHAHLAGPGIIELDVGDLDGVLRIAEDDCAHRVRHAIRPPA